MKANVADKTERLELGNIIELRGNFTEVEREDGISTGFQYECDFYRTTNKNETFESMYRKEQVELAQAYLSETDYVEVQLNRYALVYGIDSAEYREKLESRRELLAQRMEWEAIVRGEV